MDQAYAWYVNVTAAGPGAPFAGGSTLSRDGRLIFAYTTSANGELAIGSDD